MTTEIEPEPKVKEKIFRLKPEEDARLSKLIEYAYKAGHIRKQSFQDYMIFALNCALTRLKEEHKHKKGRR